MDIFYQKSEDYIYSQPSLVGDYDLYLPLEVDTEFYQPSHHFDTEKFTQTTLTIQYRAIYESMGKIFTHRDMKGAKRYHPLAESKLTALDYLETFGYTTNIKRCTDNTDLPHLTLDLYSFFAVAELFRIFYDDLLEDIKNLCVENNGKTGIEQSRRLRTFDKKGMFYNDYVQLPWVVGINDYFFRLNLRIFDTCAVHGVANYKSFCSNSGVQLAFKDLFSTDNKSRMLDMYYQRTNDFIDYALGDLYNHQALVGNAENFKLIYKSLDLHHFYTLPRLTIGSTVNKLFEACVKNLFDVSLTDKKIISKYCFFASSEYLKNQVSTTGIFNAKVDGGRCRNNRPLDTFLQGVLCDIDISGCYGDGLRSQLYPFGRPLILDYPIDSEINDYITLREFLKIYSDELVPGLWQARVSLPLGVTLKYSQDFLVSWLPPKDIRKMPTDSDFHTTDEWWTIDNVGETKIFTNQIKNAIINHDFIQWLENIASIKQRKELLDNLLVITAALYPKSQECLSIDELIEKHENHNEKNTTDFKIKNNKLSKTSIDRECYSWFAVNLGSFLITTLLVNRKKYDKKTPLNELYKLCVNTVYGDMVSPYFRVGNVVVGNNITARARALCWYMEKAFYGVQSITDGCVFDMNRIIYPKNNDYRITGENSVFISKDGNLTFKPLQVNPNNKQPLIDKWLIVYQNEKPCLVSVSNGKYKFYNNARSQKVINIYAMKHLQNQFPNVDVLHKTSFDVYGKERKGLYEFEVKSFYDNGTFHATANYSLSQNGNTRYAMRSYQKHEHNKLIKSNENISIVGTDYNPSREFLENLKKPYNLQRSNVFVRRKILKLGDYKKNYKKWRETDIFPGMTVENSSLLREFSLTQFTYQSWTQYDSWRKEYQKLIKKYGQSYEMFFINLDGTLDYQAMIENIYLKIRNGNNSFFDGTDKRKNHIYRLYQSHPQIDLLLESNEHLFGIYLSNNEELPEDTEQFYGDDHE
ncbi:hypothetical protein [Anabaena azotica]|uniref:hypothetical protein n=1 Tax=Anabaena azotica TaxID=197653 RepID=UPI0039A7606C